MSFVFLYSFSGLIMRDGVLYFLFFNDGAESWYLSILSKPPSKVPTLVIFKASNIWVRTSLESGLFHVSQIVSLFCETSVY